MAAPDTRISRLGRWLSSGFGLILIALVAMWVIEGVDSIVLDDRLQRNGINPRDAGGIDGILWTPFLHGSWGHLASNTVPFAVLGGLVAVRGLRRWLVTTAIVVLLGGGLTWLFGGSGNHIGASGIVFGYLGAIFGAAVFERRRASLATALVAILLYSTMLVGLVPQQGISWEGHLFGFLAGILAAKVLAEPRVVVRDDDADWEHGDVWKHGLE